MNGWDRAWWRVTPRRGREAVCDEANRHVADCSACKIVAAAQPDGTRVPSFAWCKAGSALLDALYVQEKPA